MGSPTTLVSDPVEVMKAEIKKRYKRYNLVLRVEEILSSFEGKKVTAAMATAVKKVLEPQGYAVYYEPAEMWSQAVLTVWGDVVSFDEAVRLSLCSGKGALFSKDYFREYNKRYFTEKERFTEIESNLEILPKLCEDYNRAVESLQAAREALGTMLVYLEA